MRLRLLMLVLLQVPTVAMAANWADDTEFTNAEFAASKRICRDLKSIALPDPARPDKRAAGGMAGCDAVALYHGIGMPVDADKAFRCAQLSEDDGPLGADALLMMMYANGVGTPRDLDRAIALACTQHGAPAESHGRVMHLAAMRQASAAPEEFHWCDDITSGYAAGFCADLDRRIADADRSVHLAQLAAHWTAPGAAPALARLRDLARDFARAHGDEIDQSGTARAALSIVAEGEVMDLLVGDLQDLAATKGWVARTDAKADADLNAVYRRVMATEFDSAAGEPSHDKIRAVQRLWLKYRDAWVAFAKLAAPDLPSQVVVDRQTRLRVEQLQDLIGEQH